MTPDSAEPGRPDRPPSSTASFGLTRRGYDPEQVEACLSRVGKALTEALEEHQREKQRADRLERRLRDVQARVPRPAPPTTGHQESSAIEHRGGPLGEGIDRLTRLAATQAGELCSGAADEANARLDRARADAEALRDDLRRPLLARAAQLERHVRNRADLLDQREQRMAEAVASAQTVLAEARTGAATIRAEAHAWARRELEAAGRRQDDRELAAARELRRLQDQSRRIHAALARLLGSLQTPVEDAVTTPAQR